MRLTADELWNAWRSSTEIREVAEGWITKPQREWTSDDEALGQGPPDRVLSVIFAVMQLTDDKQVLGGLAAGPLEDFLGRLGRDYLEILHKLALKYRRLREVLDGVWQGSMPKDVWHRIETLKQRAFS